MRVSRCTAAFILCCYNLDGLLSLPAEFGSSYKWQSVSDNEQETVDLKFWSSTWAQATVLKLFLNPSMPTWLRVFRCCLKEGNEDKSGWGRHEEVEEHDWALFERVGRVRKWLGHYNNPNNDNRENMSAATTT